MIEFKDITKVYEDGTKALNNFSLKINKGEFVTLIGPSGCGKTTTMKMINRLIEPTDGTISIHDRDIREYNIHELRWNIGYVLQEIALFPHMTIEENISIVPEMKKWSRKKIRERSRELMDMVGLDPTTYANRMPRELSGGQQQRIGVIRALAADPDIILMDEPFSALDPISREQLQSDIRSLQKKIKKTIVFVTHDMDEALALGDTVCLMKDGGIVQADMPQHLILKPKTKFVEDFIGEQNSPWQTAVDVIADRSGRFIITEQDYKKGRFSSSKLHFVKDENNNYMATIVKGVKIDGVQLSNSTPLYKAIEVIQANDLGTYPVIKKGKLVGTLSYKDIVVYLKTKTKMKDGVVPQ